MNVKQIYCTGVQGESSQELLVASRIFNEVI